MRLSDFDISKNHKFINRTLSTKLVCFVTEKENFITIYITCGNIETNVSAFPHHQVYSEVILLA